MEEKQYLPDIITEVKPGDLFQVKNFDEIKTALEGILAEYKDFKLTEDNYSEAKEIRARLNKASTAFDTRRKEVQKDYLKPFEYGKNQIDELIKMIKDVSVEIDKQVKEHDEAVKLAKKTDIEELYKTFSNPHNLPLEKCWNEKWLNATCSVKSIEKDMTAFFDKVEQDLNTISSLVEDEERREMTRKFYLESLDMGEAIVKEKSIFELTHKKATEQPTVAHPEDEEVEEFILTIEGTKSQLLEVRDYLKQKGLVFKFERRN